jgi:PAS domain S-box-containing protein
MAMACKKCYNPLTMPVMLFIDVVALGLTVIIASSLAVTVLGSGFRNSPTIPFAFYAASAAAGGIISLILRISIIFSVGNKSLLLELATLCLALNGPFILLFTARYLSMKRRWPDIIAIAALVLIAAFSPALFTHGLVSNPYMIADGLTLFELHPVCVPAAAIPAITMLLSVTLFFSKRRFTREPLIPMSLALVFIGFILGGVFLIHFPLMSITNALGVGVLGIEVARRQLFNPLRELTARLEKKVAERTLELEKTRSGVEYAISERTGQLIQEISERRRVEESLKERADRLELIARIGQKTTALLGLDELLGQTAAQIRDVFDYLCVHVFLIEGDSLVLRASTHASAVPLKGQLSLRVGEEGITGWVAATGEPLVVPDVAMDPRYVELIDRVNPRSEIAVPLRLRGKITGVLDAQSMHPAAFTPLDLFTLQTIADQLAVAMENARLYEALNLELSERQRTEKVLRESEEHFRNLAEQSPNLIFINTRGKVVYANRKAEITGYSREEIYGPDFNFHGITAPEYRELVAENFRRHMNGEELPPYEYAFFTKSGRRIDAILTTTLMKFAGEKAILGIITDITPRKRTEGLLRALNTAALAMEQVLTPEEILPAAMHELESLGYSCAVALADTSKTTLSRRYASGKKTEGKAPPLPIDGSPAAVGAAMRGLKTTFFSPEADPRCTPDALEVIAPWLVCAPEGSSLCIISPLRAGEEALGLLSVAGETLMDTDCDLIAAFAYLIAAAWRKTALMHDLARSLNELRATQDLLLHAQKMEAIGRLAGGIAHDFNNLLTVISGYTSLLVESLTGNDRALSDLGEIKNAIKRASALTSRLLAFSRRQILQPVVLDLNVVLAGCAKLLRPIIGEDIDLVIRPADGLGRIKADPYQIEQVIINLAVNARDAMPSGGTLTLETAARALTPEEAAEISLAAGPYVVLTVKDTGIGISEEVRHHLFEPFFTTKADGKGTGLGLSTVYGIVKQTGGSIGVSSAPGAGTAFSICFPETTEHGTEPPLEQGAQRAPRGTGTILVVEDDDSVRELAGRILQNAGYTVLTARSPEAAIGILGDRRVVDLMITDMVMPGMNGMELSLKIHETRPDLPVLFISGYTDDPGIRLGVPDGLPFLSKPFQPDDLLKKVTDAIRVPH